MIKAIKEGKTNVDLNVPVTPDGGGDGDGTHSITFYPDGTLDAHYTSDGTQHSMYDAWEATDETVVLSRTAEGDKTSSKTFTAYRYDGTRILLIGSGWDADASMILTAKP